MTDNNKFAAALADYKYFNERVGGMKSLQNCEAFIDNHWETICKALTLGATPTADERARAFDWITRRRDSFLKDVERTNGTVEEIVEISKIFETIRSALSDGGREGKS